MYRYDEFDRRLVRERVTQFRGQVRRYLEGRLDEEEFRQLRLRNGLYVQRHAPMLRVAIPYGLLSSNQLHKLAHIARAYDKGFGHFTTRQNLQYNWPKLEDVPDILQELADVEMRAIQTSGNVVRNITTDHLAGVAADELEDPRPYCELLRQWSTLHPEFNWLPRKFKVAVTGARDDRAAVQLHDIGLRLVRGDRGEIGFKIFVGGGMGRTPVIGKAIRPFLEKRHLLSYVEAILRIYNLHGRRDNLYKARIKILVNALGIDEFRRQVDAEWARMRDDGLELYQAEIDRMKAFFAPPEYEELAENDGRIRLRRDTNPIFNAWRQHNTVAHKVAGYRIVYVSLKAPGVPPGDLTAAQMDAVADLADKYSFGELRTTHEQNLALAHVRQTDLFALWESLKSLRLATPNIGTLSDMICCPGLDYCALANAGTISVARQINARFDDLDELYGLGEIRLKMSGCMNACGHHHVGHIGILGVEKNGEEWYQITLGGSSGNRASLGERLGPAVSRRQVVDAVERILRVYLDRRLDGESFLETYRRIGMPTFREHVYDDHQKKTDNKKGSLAA